MSRSRTVDADRLRVVPCACVRRMVGSGSASAGRVNERECECSKTSRDQGMPRWSVQWSMATPRLSTYGNERQVPVCARYRLGKRAKTGGQLLYCMIQDSARTYGGCSCGSVSQAFTRTLALALPLPSGPLRLEVRVREVVLHSSATPDSCGGDVAAESRCRQSSARASACASQHPAQRVCSVASDMAHPLRVCHQPAR